MNNTKIIQKMVKKAEGAGFTLHEFNEHKTYTQKIDLIHECTVKLVYDGYTFLMDIEKLIFSHRFAKVFWGEELVCPECGDPKCESRGHAVKWQNALDDWVIAWKYHLSEMVLEPEPLKYIEKFL